MIGKGAPNLGGSEKTHGAPLGESEIAATRQAIGWPHAPFEVPAGIRETWAEVGRRGKAARAAWEKRLAAAPHRAAFEAAIAGDAAGGRLPAPERLPQRAHREGDQGRHAQGL